MFKIGEIKRNTEIGKKDKRLYIFAACLDCGKGRWTPLIKNKPKCLRCRACHLKRMQVGGKESHSWKGGKRYHNGYTYVYVEPTDFFAPMANKVHYVLEHRLVVAKALGRCLHRWEIVHHKNGIKDDNPIENLQLVTDDRHKQISILEQRITHLEKRVLLLEAENIRLKMELRRV